VLCNANRVAPEKHQPRNTDVSLSFPSHFTCTKHSQHDGCLNFSLKLFLSVLQPETSQHASGSDAWWFFCTDTHRPCVICVDARRYGCTAEMLAYTTHLQRYLGSNPRAWLEGGLHHKSNLCFLCADTLLSYISLQSDLPLLLCLLSTLYAY
jgi:hypothetical protein